MLTPCQLQRFDGRRSQATPLLLARRPPEPRTYHRHHTRSSATTPAHRPSDGRRPSTSPRPKCPILRPDLQPNPRHLPLSCAGRRPSMARGFLRSARLSAVALLVHRGRQGTRRADRHQAPHTGRRRSGVAVAPERGATEDLGPAVSAGHRNVAGAARGPRAPSARHGSSRGPAGAPSSPGDGRPLRGAPPRADPQRPTRCPFGNRSDPTPGPSGPRAVPAALGSGVPAAIRLSSVPSAPRRKGESPHAHGRRCASRHVAVAPGPRGKSLTQQCRYRPGDQVRAPQRPCSRHPASSAHTPENDSSGVG